MSSWLTTTSSSLRIAFLSVYRPLHLHCRAASTMFQGFSSCHVFFYPFRYRTISLDTQRHKRTILDNWRQARRDLNVECKLDTTWSGHNTFVLIAHTLPCNRHGLVYQLLLSDLELNILLPGVSLCGWGPCFDCVVIALGVYSLF